MRWQFVDCCGWKPNRLIEIALQRGGLNYIFVLLFCFINPINLTRYRKDFLQLFLWLENVGNSINSVR